MLSFLGMVFLVYGAMHLYAFSKLWQAFPHSPVFGVALVCLALVLVSAPFMARFLEHHQWHAASVAVSWVSYVWMGYLFLFCVVFMAFDLGHVLAGLLGFQWHIGNAAVLGSVAFITIVLFGYGLIEARQIQVVRLTIHTPKLSGGPLTVAQISDLHLGITQGDGLLRRIIARLHELRPDIVVATGDVVDGHGDDYIRLAQRFREYKPPQGEFAVTGNHEYYAGLQNSLQFLHDAGFTVLRGESLAAGGVVFVGVDDSGGLRRGQVTKLHADAAAIPRDAFVILLKHQPVAEQGIPFDLQLSGHIHGGQIFPFNFITRMVYGVSTGLTRLAGGRWMYVSRGTGTWGPPIRLFAAPEITLIRIESGKTQQVALSN